MRKWLVVLAVFSFVFALSSILYAQGRQQRRRAGNDQQVQNDNAQQGQGEQQRLRKRDGSCMNDGTQPTQQRLRRRDGSCGNTDCPRGGGAGYGRGYGRGRGAGGGCPWQQ